MRFHATTPFYRNSVSLLALLTLATQASAQDAEFLGTIALGESKREVQTDTATALTVVDQEEIDDRQASTIAQLVDSVPSVSLVNGSTPAGSGINIRGFGANSTFGTDQKVAVLVDGASVGSEELYRLGTQLFTDPALYKSVSVVRGTVGSFAYGSGVVGGVVQLDTKDASDFTGGNIGFNAGQTVQFASNGDGIAASSVLAFQPTQDFEFLVNYTHRQQDIQTDGNRDEIGSSDFFLPSYLLKGRYTFGQNRDQSLTFSYSDTSTEEENVLYDTFQTTADAFGRVNRETQTQTAVIRYDYEPLNNDLIDLSVTLSYANQQFDQEYVPGTSTCETIPGSCFFPFPPGGFGTTNADHKYETAKLNITNVSLFSTGAVDHELTAGVEFIQKDRRTQSAAPGGTDNRWAVFAVNEARIGDALTITPALRYEASAIDADDYTTRGGTVIPADTYVHDAVMGGLSARYAFANGFALFGSAAYTESFPIIDDIEFEDRIDQSEKSTTYEVGFSYDSFDVFAAGDELAFKANYYQTSTTDITSYQSSLPLLDASGNPVSNGRGGTVSAVLDEIETKGWELEASYAMESGFYIDANANIAEGSEITEASGSTEWRGTPANSLGLTIGQKIGEELDVSWEIVANDALTIGDEDFDSFTVHNLRATYIPQSGVLEGVEMRASIENAFNEDYTAALSTRPGVGRNVILSVAKSF
jgi:hemoglobin/transferrin/lactoferrin receptor protein